MNPESPHFQSEDIDFARDVVLELAQLEDMFKLPTSLATSLKGAMNDLAFDFGFWGEEKLLEHPTGANRRYLFGLPNNRADCVKIYERGSEVWLDVSALNEGDGGDRIYHAVADWAFNTNRVFIGDPQGLSEIATIRRTYHMLSSALKHESTAHFQPANEQLDGDLSNGIVPLLWQGHDGDKLSGLIQCFVTTAFNIFPLLHHVQYQYHSAQFIFTETLEPITRRGLARLTTRVSGVSDASIDQLGLDKFGDTGGVRSAGGGDSRSGAAAVWLASLIRCESGEKSIILADVWRKPPESLMFVL